MLSSSRFQNILITASKAKVVNTHKTDSFYIVGSDSLALHAYLINLFK